jgi:rubrerythrin
MTFSTVTNTNKLAQYVANWQAECNGAALYRVIGELQENPQLKKIYHRLAEAEERHSCFWEAKLRAARQPLSPFKLN